MRYSISSISASATVTKADHRSCCGRSPAPHDMAAREPLSEYFQHSGLGTRLRRMLLYELETGETDLKANRKLYSRDFAMLVTLCTRAKPDNHDLHVSFSNQQCTQASPPRLLSRLVELRHSRFKIDHADLRWQGHKQLTVLIFRSSRAHYSLSEAPLEREFSTDRLAQGWAVDEFRRAARIAALHTTRGGRT